MAFIEFKDVTVRISNHTILDKISFILQEGFFVSLLGPNGAGKTTLVKALAGLLPYEGSIKINGLEVRDMPSKELGQNLAYIPQGHEVNWPMRVRDLVGLGRLPHQSILRPNGSDDEIAIDSALKITNLSDFTERRFDQLSGGEKSRVMIARSLASQPLLLLADEPTVALDPYHQLQILSVLHQNTQQGLNLIAILHDISQAAQFSDQILLLDKGKLIHQGKPDEVLTNEYLKKIYNISFAQHIELTKGIWKID